MFDLYLVSKHGNDACCPLHTLERYRNDMTSYTLQGHLLSLYLCSPLEWTQAFKVTVHGSGSLTIFNPLCGSIHVANVDPIC